MHFFKFNYKIFLYPPPPHHHNPLMTSDNTRQNLFVYQHDLLHKESYLHHNQTTLIKVKLTKQHHNKGKCLHRNSR